MQAPYRVELSPAAQRQTRRLPQDQVHRIRTALHGLAADPRPQGCVKLAGFTSVWRIRAGRFRIVYEIFPQDRRLMVLRVARRAESTYRGL